MPYSIHQYQRQFAPVSFSYSQGLPARAVGLALFCLLAGCSSLSRVYVHDDNTQKIIDAVSSTWKTALPTTVFDQQKTFLAQLATDEVATAKMQIAGQRDLQLVQLMNDPTAESIRHQIEDQLQQLSGARTVPAAATADQQVASDRFAIDNDTAQIALLTALLKSDGYRGTLPTCNGGLVPTGTLTPNQHVDWDALVTDCDSLSQKKLQLDADLKRAVVSGASGDFSDTLQALDGLTKQLADQQKQAAALGGLLATKKKAVDDAPKGSPAAAVAAKVLQFCLADPATSSDTKAANPANAPTLASELNTCSVSVANDADPLVKQLKHGAVETEIQSVLTSLLNANASAGNGAAGASGSSASTTAALRTLDSLADVADAISTSKEPSVNALLVALAYEQYQVNVNADEVETLQQKISIYEERREAYLSQIAFLARVQLELAKPISALPPRHGELAPEVRDIGRIRANLNSAWNIGAYRALLTHYAEDDLIRADALRASSTIVTAWQGILQPAFDELAAYGKGGLDAQTVSNLIIAVVNAGGLAAVAHGVN